MTQPDTKVDNDLTDLIAQLQGITEDPSSTIVSFETSSRKAAGLIDGWSGVGLALDRASLLLGDDSLHMTAVNAHDPERARALLKEAGVTLPLSLSLTVPPPAPVR